MLRWLDAGMLPHARTGGGHRRIPGGTLAEFMWRQGLPVPQELESPGPRFLLVDDHPAFLASFEHLLRNRVPEANIRLAADGFSAGAIVARFEPHILFLDLVMPGLSGDRVCEIVRKELRMESLVIVITTGHPNRVCRAQLQSLGVDHLLRKPIDSAELNAVIAAFAPGQAPTGRRHRETAP